MNNTINYYNIHFNEYYNKTINIDMSNLYESFLKRINYGGKILDLGCGSGRDSFFFKKNGYNVTAIDGSIKLANKASNLLGQEVNVCKFEKLVLNKDKFDGVWASASLLHINRFNIVGVINNISLSLKNNGILYVSFKYGNAEYVDDNGRYFNCYTEESFKNVLNKIENLKIIEMYKSEDKVDNRNNITCLNVLCIKNERSIGERI